MGPIFIDALGFAMAKHAGQFRKGTMVPYLSHPLRVAGLVLDYGADETTAVAALLHDTIEDAGGLGIGGEIAQRFGDEVLQQVLDCSDSTTPPGVPKRPWRERKEEAIAKLPRIARQSRLIIACDKIDNVQSMLRAYRREGASLWQLFQTGREGTLWYLNATLERLREIGDCPACDELEELVRQLP